MSVGQRTAVVACAALLLISSVPTLAMAYPTALSDDTSAANDTSLGNRVAPIALTALGLRYSWGGTSPETGFDCTGFVAWVFAHFDVFLPHNETGQLYSGPHVELGDLETGDIVVFKNTYKPGPSHTGIYLGDGTFIHASDPWSGVTISSLHDSYWGPRFVVGVRLDA